MYRTYLYNLMCFDTCVYICEVFSTIKLGDISVTLRSVLVPLGVPPTAAALIFPAPHPHTQGSAAFCCSLVGIFRVRYKWNHRGCSLSSSSFSNSVQLSWDSSRMLGCLLIVWCLSLLGGISWHGCGWMYLLICWWVCGLLSVWSQYEDPKRGFAFQACA